MTVFPAAALWPQMRPRLSRLEWLWSLFVKILLRAGKRSPLLEREVVARLTQKMSPYGFQPEPRICNRGGFAHAADIYDAIKAGQLS